MYGFMWPVQLISYIIEESENSLTQFLENIFVCIRISHLLSIQIVKWLTPLPTLSTHFLKISEIVSVTGSKSTQNSFSAFSKA